jgi:hypothetical protein
MKGAYENTKAGSEAISQWLAWAKKDSGSARKEKQQIRKTCYYPNRLNLLD